MPCPQVDPGSKIATLGKNIRLPGMGMGSPPPGGIAMPVRPPLPTTEPACHSLSHQDFFFSFPPFFGLIFFLIFPRRCLEAAHRTASTV